jgi:drug/metabolite transporter (DMT)-like permease
VSLGYLYLILALLSAAGLGISHKVADIKECKPAAINLMLFLSASVLLWGYTVLFKVMVQGTGLFPPFSLKAVGVAVVCGTCACFGILTFQIGVRYGRITTSWLIVNLSTLLPAALSLFIYQEWRHIRWQHAVSLALVMLSVVLLWRDKVAETQKTEPLQSPTGDAASSTAATVAGGGKD